MQARRRPAAGDLPASTAGFPNASTISTGPYFLQDFLILLASPTAKVSSGLETLTFMRGNAAATICRIKTFREVNF